MYPCLVHSLTEDGIDAIEEGVDCIITFVHYGYKNIPISDNFWRFFPQLIYVCVGNETEKVIGDGIEILGPMCLALKNYITRDPDGIMKIIIIPF